MKRHEGTWICARPGSGKSQLIQAWMVHDFDGVERGDTSIVLMESTKDMIDKVAGLKIFAPGQPLHNKLVILDPDPQYPLALNIFAVGKDLHTIPSPRQRETMRNTTIELIELVLDAILSVDITAKQRAPFRYVIEAMLEIPGATLKTLRELFSPGGYQLYASILRGRLDPDTQEFFESRFDSSAFESTRKEVMWRLDNLGTVKHFARMFSAPTMRFSFFDELQQSKVILINTDMPLLTRSGTEAFGRFMLGLLMQAVERRALLPREERRTIACYIDECQDYFKDDTSVTNLLDKGRKHALALVCAHQRIKDQLSPGVLSALSNVSTKISARPNADDQLFICRSLNNVEPEAFDQLEKHEMMMFIEGEMKRPAKITVPIGVMEKMPRMSPTEHEKIIADMRSRYSYQPHMTQKPPVKEAPTGPLSSPQRDAHEPIVQQKPDRFILTDLPERLEEAQIDEWYINEGDYVNANEIVLELRNFGNFITLCPPRDGRISRLLAKEGDMVKVGTVLAEYADETEPPDDDDTHTRTVTEW
jgi:biotin carboxyl carrier protein